MPLSTDCVFLYRSVLRVPVINRTSIADIITELTGQKYFFIVLLLQHDRVSCLASVTFSKAEKNDC
jgi:hypothetical protein